MRSGQTLIEVLIAFAVTIVIGVGLITVSLATQKSAAGARNESQATKLAQEYTEKLRVMRDSKTWSEFLLVVGANGERRIDIGTSENDVAGWRIVPVSGSSPCNVASPSVMWGETVLVDNVNFCRKMTVSGYSATSNSLSFRVEVGWKEGENVRSSRADIILSKWCGSEITGTSTEDCL